MGALELMDFDGMEKVKDRVQQGQTLLNVVNQLMQENMMLKAQMGVIPVEGNAPTNNAQPAPKGMGSAVVNSQKAGLTDYGARLAANAKPDMNAQ